MRTAPCLVVTLVPSISGSRSRCTPSRETSAPPRCSRAADLVDLVEEHDAVLLDRVQRLAPDLLLVEQLVGLLLHQQRVAVGDRHALALGALAERLAEDVAEIEHAHLRARHARDVEGRQRCRRRGRRPRARSPSRRARPRAAGGGTCRASRAAALAPTRASSTRSSALSSALAATSLRSRSRVIVEPDLDQVADDRFDVAADIADLGELGRLDLDERRLGELGQAARDLGLAAAGRADGQDVLGQHLLAQRLVELLAPPAVAQRDRDRALGGVLADDEAIELGDDLARGQTRSWRLDDLEGQMRVGVDAESRRRSPSPCARSPRRSCRRRRSARAPPRARTGRPSRCRSGRRRARARRRCR